MEISCKPSGIVEAERPGQGITDIAGAGFRNIVLDMALFCTSRELENIGKSNIKRSKNKALVSEHPEELYSRAEGMLEQCTRKKLGCSVAMMPCLSRNTKRSDLNDLLKRLAKESIKICGKSNCKYLVVRPLFAGIAEEELWEVNRTYYLELADEARKNNVRILLENQCKDINGHLVRGICSDGREAADWIDALNREAGEERFGFCMDAGTCNLCGQNMYDFIMNIGDRLKTVILRDCDGVNESALLPFTCAGKGQSQTDWLNLIRGLRRTGFDGELIIDFRDTATAFSPILRPELVRMAKSVADYFKWQIEMENLLRKYPVRVLFGAGNMCRNYMKCYGEEYPPLFTCDNNRALWGNEFCGLEVKNPESLRNLPEDCVIFICNIYYREIEEQLRNMGIANPIEFFNDEYMPTFYFDRLEDR
ncbi:MAG: sugar phosphate isomerase/epimerase [Lachnospiraceae bacterium]|nr:sugar phosphate isomerase/epimerase [Lachnospiraceae bacterium]